MASRNLHRRTGISMAEMQARVRASLNFTTLTAPTSVSPIQVTAEQAAIAAEETRYANERVAYR